MCRYSNVFGRLPNVDGCYGSAGLAFFMELFRR